MYRLLAAIRNLRHKPSRGQSMVEFALVSVVLFMFLMGILDAGRLLFAYSVVSNAAQEGTRYGVLRPRDMLGPTEATRVAQVATLTPTALRHTYINAQVVPTDTACNVFTKTRSEAWGIDRNSVQVAAWYDSGNGTPASVTIPADLETAAMPGYRIVVEARYHFDFIVPYMQIFRPNGFDITMRSARTILQPGRDRNFQCTINYTPAPTYTPSDTPTPTRTLTRTATRTFTATSTATPVCGVSGAYACLTVTGCTTGCDWQARVAIFGWAAGDAVNLSANSQNRAMTSAGNGVFTFDSATQGGPTIARNALVTFSYVPGPGHSGACAPLTWVVSASTTCGTPTATPSRTTTLTPTQTGTPTWTLTPSRTPTITRTVTRTWTALWSPTSTPTDTPTNTTTPLPTFTPTNTPTPTVTRTRTQTRTPTATATPYCPLSGSLSAVRDSQGSYKYRVKLRANMVTAAGLPATGLTIQARTASGESITLAELAPGTYGGCTSNNYVTNTTVTFSVVNPPCPISWNPTIDSVNGQVLTCP